MQGAVHCCDLYYLTMDLVNRCGEDLVSLYKSPAVQSFLNDTPARSLQPDKPIYQPGALRKVRRHKPWTAMAVCTLHIPSLDTSMQVATKLVSLNDLKGQAVGVGTVKIHQMRGDSAITVLLASLPAETVVYPAGAVTGGSDEHELINVQSYVQFSAVWER